MPDKQAQSTPAAPSRARRCTRFVGILLLAILATLAAEHWRGQRNLKACTTKMTAQGEILDVRKLWPPPSAASVTFSNETAKALQKLPKALNRFAGQLSGMVVGENHHSRRGSQEPHPPMSYQQSNTNTWRELGEVVDQSEPALHSLRQALKTPPADMGYDIIESLENCSFPHFVPVRVGAQALQSAALYRLHQHDLDAALDNLEALLAYGQLYSQEPTLVSFMIRIAVIGLSVDVSWDALQDHGWTEAQLARLQRAWETTLRLSQLPRAMEGERAARLYETRWFSAHTYEEWLDRYQPICQGFGIRIPARHGATPVRLWRNWAFHPIWSYAWADQEKQHYLEHVQIDLDALRQATREHSWLLLKRTTDDHHQNYRPPPASWRFYLNRPMADDLAEVIGGGPGGRSSGYPYANFSRAWLTAFQNQTLGEMVVTAIALKRYTLRVGQMPDALATMVPSLLKTVPRDFIDGQPLRYRRNADGTFCLYSVGEDARDDGGDPTVEEPDQRKFGACSWTGRDWVWPKTVEDGGSERQAAELPAKEKETRKSPFS